MTATAIRPEVVALLTQIDLDAFLQPPHEQRHSDGQPVTEAEAQMLSQATFLEIGAALQYHETLTQMHVELNAKRHRVLDLCRRYSNVNDDRTLRQILAIMSPEDRAEAKRILGEVQFEQILLGETDSPF